VLQHLPGAVRGESGAAAETSDFGDKVLFQRRQERSVNTFVAQLRESTDHIEGISMDHLTDMERNP
jgi:hypothetical protein